MSKACLHCAIMAAIFGDGQSVNPTEAILALRMVEDDIRNLLPEAIYDEMIVIVQKEMQIHRGRKGTH